MIPSDLHYNWPAGGNLILAGALSFFFFWYLYRARKKITFAKTMIVERSLTLYWVKALLFSFALTLCAIAMMDPAGNGHYPEGTLPPDAVASQGNQTLRLKRKAHDIVILLDVSASMAVTDTNLKKTRLDQAKEITDNLIAGLNGETAALYTFTSKTEQQSPLTNDYIFLRLTLQEMQINEGGIPGTDITDALTLIQKRFYPSGRSRTEIPKLNTLILLTDGEDTAIEALPEGQRHSKESETANLLRTAAENNLRVYTIGLGSLTGGTIPNVTFEGKPVQSRLNATLLQEIARVGRGKYFQADLYSTPELTGELWEDRAKDPPYYDENRRVSVHALLRSLLGDTGLIYDRYMKFIAGLALLCLAAALLLPDTLGKTGFLLLLMCASQLPLRADPKEEFQDRQSEMLRAKAYVQSNMFEQARSIYENLLGLSFSDAQKGILHYNIGAVYLHEKAWKQAISQLILAVSTKEGFPYFYRYAYGNLALAYYIGALSMQKEDPEEALKLLQTSLKSGTRIPGALTPSFSDAIKVQTALTRLLTYNRKFAETDSSKGLLKLLDTLDDAQESIGFTLGHSMTPALAESYNHLFVNEQKQRLPLWDAMTEKLNDKNKKRLNNARDDYGEMINLIGKNEPAKALKFAEAAENTLLKIMEQLSETSPLKARLQRILHAYERLLQTKIWKKERIKILQDLYETILKGDFIPDADSIQAKLTRGKELWDKALIASKDNDMQSAILLAISGEEQIRLALLQTPPFTSMDILKGMIRQGTFLQSSEKDALTADKNLETIFSLFREGQASLIALSELYYRTLYEEQRLAFGKGVCQGSPWNEALPYFESGRLAIIEADELLRKETGKLDNVIEYQNQAVENWQKTIEAIKNPSSGRASCFVENSGTSSESSSMQENTDLTSLLQMEQEDRRKPELQQIRTNTVRRPW